MRYLPPVALLVLAAICVFAAMQRSDLRCDRTSCTYDDAFRSAVHTFPVTDVREVRFIDGLGKNRDSAETALVFANGRELRIGRAGTARARATHRTLQQFFAGEARSLHVSSQGSAWFYLAAAAALAGAIALGLRARKAPRVHRSDTPRAPIWPRHKRTILIGAALVAVAVLAQLALTLWASQAQGTLALTCIQRCRFQGMECLPGGELTTTLDPGTYTIEVWASSGSALWIPQTFDIALGETTRFECR